MLDDNSATDDSLAVDPFQLQPGEAAQVGDAVVAALRASLTNRAPAARAPGPEIAGEWELRVDFMHGQRVHRLALEQRGSDIAGHQRSVQFEGPVTGAIDADRILLTFDGRHEAAIISYRLEGQVSNGAMTGTALLGAASDQNQGIVNRTQFGAGEWRAQRVA